VFVLDEEGTVITVNQAVTEQFGDESVLLEKPVEEFLGDPTLGDPEIEGRVNEISVTQAGETRHFNVSKSVLTDYRGELLAQVLVCRDLTEKRRREEQLELLKNVQSRFLRHNLRNKLNAILAHAEFMRDGTGPSRDESYGVIVDTSERLIEWGEKARTIERLVESAERTHYEVCSELEHIVDKMRATHPGVQFETDIDDEAWLVTVPQIGSALENLIDNAARYNTADEPCVRVTTETSADRVTVVIRDNGPGIDDDEIQTITTGKQTQLEHGSGLGLWLVYWAVEISGGDISFDTDDGTAVTLEFERVGPPEE
jgi:PAS domain S-box-containing protein